MAHRTMAEHTKVCKKWAKDLGISLKANAGASETFVELAMAQVGIENVKMLEVGRDQLVFTGSIINEVKRRMSK